MFPFDDVIMQNGLRMKMYLWDDDPFVDDLIDRYFENYDLPVFGWEAEVDESQIRKLYTGRRGPAKTS